MTVLQPFLAMNGTHNYRCIHSKRITNIFFSRRISSEKSPTIVVANFFFFFRQMTDLIVYVPLFSTEITRFTVKPAVTGSSPCFSQKVFRAFAEADETEGSRLSFFSAL